MSFTSDQLHWAHGTYGFKIMFKCLTGITSENGKFFISLKEKLTQTKSTDRCERTGFLEKYKLYNIIRDIISFESKTQGLV